MIRRYKYQRQKRHTRIRAKVKGTAVCPRLNVFRSSKHVYAQIIDDVKGYTVVACSDSSKQWDNEAMQQLTKTQMAKKVGEELAKKALKEGVETVVFDRGGYKYHGRVKALAEGAREGGLKF